jgi:hypothetical protein
MFQASTDNPPPADPPATRQRIEKEHRPPAELEYICRHDITAIRRFITIFVYISNLITRLIYEILQENRRNDN